MATMYCMRWSLAMAVALAAIVFIFAIFAILKPEMPTRLFQKALVINLDQDVDRYQEFVRQAAMVAPVTRFPAIVGKNVGNTEDIVAPKALADMHLAQSRGYRTHHHQLSQGAIGCFLSHVAILEQLVADDECDVYLILEDDNHLMPESVQLMSQTRPPPDWDMLLGVYHRVEGSDVDGGGGFKKVTGFWGTGGYLIRKTGAAKILREVQERQIDGQIDAFLARMSQEGKLDLYAANTQWFRNVGVDSSIQVNVVQQIPGVDPFSFDGYRV